MLNEFEKIEKMIEKADVSYEEAKIILEEAGGDLLEAIVILERYGKIRKAEKSIYEAGMSNAEDPAKAEEKAIETEYVKTEEKAGEKKDEKAGRRFGRFIRKALHSLRNSSFQVDRKEETICIIPSLAFVIIMILCWEVLIPLMLIGLFLGFRYSFTGPEEMKAANGIFEAAEDIAGEVKAEFQSC